MKKTCVFIFLLLGLSGCSDGIKYSLVDLDSADDDLYVLQMDALGNYSVSHGYRLDVCVNDYLYFANRSLAPGAVMLNSLGKPVKCNMDSYSDGVVKELSLTEEQRTRIEKMRKKKFKDSSEQDVMGI